MAHQIVQNIPYGGLDLDSDNRYVEVTDYRNAINIRNGVAYAGKQNVATNVKGNTLVPYTLPSGYNQVIGAYENRQNNTVLYFVYNDAGNQCILQYDPNGNSISKIAEYDFGWVPSTKITSVSVINNKLLYWSDPKPRKINIEKSILEEKFKEWEIVLAKSVIGNDLITFKVADMNGNILAQNNLFVTGNTIEEKLQNLAAEITINFGVYFTPEACGCVIKLRENAVNSYYPIIDGVPYYLIIPTNWYGLTLTDRMFDRAKWQPPLEPVCEYKKDTTINYNRVKEKVFQFRLQYWYDDGEGSDLACGAISEIPINNVVCNEAGADAYNYIELLMPDVSLITPADLAILKEVRILVREGNEGIWRTVENITPCEWFDYVGGQNVATYSFYNDIATTAIDDATAAKPYDDVPLEVGAEIVVKNRGILADVKKGYDAPDCVEVEVTQDFEDRGAEQGYTISGLVRFMNFYLDNVGSSTNRLTSPNIAERRAPILFDSAVDDTYPYFGGVMFKGGTCDVYSEAATLCKQYIPEGGVPVYLAGTDYFAISKQRNIQAGAISTRGDGSIDATGTPNKNIIKSFYQYGSANTGDNNYDVYSTFEIRNVPNGVYVLRVGSHWCSFGDKLGKGVMYDLYNGRAYQRTSTHVWGMNVYDANTNTFSWQPATEITVTVNNGDVFIGEFVIADLCYYQIHNANTTRNISFDELRPRTGYLYCADGGATDLPTLANGTTVEKTFVYLGLVTNYQGANVDMTYTITDHNGYFFFTNGYEFTTNPTYYINGINAIQINSPAGAIGNDICNDNYYAANNTSALNDLVAQDMTFISSDFLGGSAPPQAYSNQLLDIILPVTDPDAKLVCATYVEGKVIDANGDPISNALVIYENGKYTYTDLNGDYRILAWGDMGDGYNYAGNPAVVGNPTQQDRRILDNLVISSNSWCVATYPNGQQVSILIDPFFNNYTLANPYLVADFIIDEGDSNIGKARKRGGSYLLGVRYYDDAGRFCSVIQGAEVYIPFITEDLHQYFPTQYSAGTYKYGKPTITATINTPPPSWAKYMRFLWTRNLYQGKYLQWCANEVKYITTYDNDLDTYTETTYQNGDATMIMINISNIATYARQNNQSQVGYSFEDGDRLRLIADRDIKYFQGLLDTEVLGYRTGGWLLIKNQVSLTEIKSGTLFEVYNNKPVTEDKIFYECGQPIKIVNGVYETDTVTFDSGDTYWRGRIIPVQDDTTNFSSIYPLIVEDRSISDFYPSEDEDIGRAGIIDPTFKQMRYPTMMQHSNIYVEGSAVNGLSSFEILNFKQLNVGFGAIKRLFYVGNTLLSIHENKVVANYIELRSLSDANTTDGLLAISDAYFGNDRPLDSEYGTQHAESCYQYNGLVYFVDKARGVVCRYDNNGMDAISDKKVRSFFKQRCADGFDNAWAVFDPYYREYIVSLDDTTIAWNEEKNRWTTFYSFVGECYSSLLRGIVSFREGQIWVHDKNPLCNNFYGIQFKSTLTPIPHLDNEKVIWFNLSLQGLQESVNVNSWSILNITNSDGQLSRLTKQQFRKLENFWYAAFLRDTTDTTQPNPIINGRKLRGQDLVLTMENDATEQWYLQQVITSYTPSARSVI